MAIPIKAVIFDIGGVITKFPDLEYLMYLSNLSGVGAAKIKKTIDALIPALEKGRMSSHEFESRVARKLKIQKKELEWYEYYVKYVTIDVDITDLIAQLHKDYVTAYITNIDASKYVYFRKVLGRNLFDYRFASCDLHLRKPDPRIYRHVLYKMKQKPEETVFIDNQIENVRGAYKVGMNAILYKNRRQLDIDLAKFLD